MQTYLPAPAGCGWYPFVSMDEFLCLVVHCTLVERCTHLCAKVWLHWGDIWRKIEKINKNHTGTTSRNNGWENTDLVSLFSGSDFSLCHHHKTTALYSWFCLQIKSRDYESFGSEGIPDGVIYSWEAFHTNLSSPTPEMVSSHSWRTIAL